MKVYNNLNTVVEYGLTFDTFKTKAENIYKDNYIYLEEIGYDGEGYFDLSINKLYWRLSPGKEYTVFDCVLNEDLEIPRNSTNSTIKIVSYTSLEIDNFLFLSEDVSNGFDENGNIITLLTEHTTLEVVTYKKMCSDIKQKRPTDESQDWEDTEETREYECEKTNDENEHCECGGWTYRWIEDGEVCDQGNRHKKMKYQYKEHCDDLEWKNVQPLMYKIGDIIEYNSDKCESYEYKEEWDETQFYCGYDLNSTYCEGLTPTSLYKIRYASIKKQSDIVWQPIFSRSLIAAEEVKKNCFQCGWSSGKTVTAKVETEICGSEIKTKYPTLSGSVTDTYSYDVIKRDYMKTAPYPTNNDEMTQDEWVWEITRTTYSTSRNGSDCKCGYRTSGWTNTDIVKCGYEINQEETNFKVLSVNENYSGAGWTYIGGEYYEIVSNPLGHNSSGTCEVTFSVDVKSYIYYRILMNGESGDRLYAHIVDKNVNNYDNYWNSSKSYFTSDYQTVSAGTHTICFTYVTDSSGRDYSDNVRIWFYAKPYSNSKTDTYSYVKQLGYYKCGGVDYEPTGAVQWSSQGSGKCPFFNWTFTWSATTEEICGWKLNENTPSLTINSVQGNWLRDGNTFTSNVINVNQTTTERIYFKVSSPTAVTFTIDQSSENSSDYLVISNLDKPIVSGYPTSTGPSYNYYNHRYKTTGSTSMTISDTGEHFVELMYRKTNGGSLIGRENVIVKLGINGEYVDTTMYVKMLEYVNKGDGVSALTGNQYYSAKTTNCYDCGYKKYEWNDTGEDVCCGYLDEQLEITRVEGLGTEPGTWYYTNGTYMVNRMTTSGDSAPLKIYYKTNSGVRFYGYKNSTNSKLFIKVGGDDVENPNSMSVISSSSYSGTIYHNSESIIDGEEHFVIVKANYGDSSLLNYDVKLALEPYRNCTYGNRYHLLQYQYTEDGETWKNVDPPQFKYGNTAKTNDSTCGYVVPIDQWVEICKDCTYESVFDENGVLNTTCAQYYDLGDGIERLYSIRKRQISKDYGETWEDTFPLETDRHRYLKP